MTTCRYCGVDLHIKAVALLTPKGRPSKRTISTWAGPDDRTTCRSGATLHEPARDRG